MCRVWAKHMPHQCLVPLVCLDHPSREWGKLLEVLLRRAEAQSLGLAVMSVNWILGVSSPGLPADVCRYPFLSPDTFLLLSSVSPTHLNGPSRS